jgi:mRNA interferase YafQ
MNIIISTAFKKDYKRLSNNDAIISAVDKTILQLESGKPLPKEFKEHPLKGNYKGYFDCHIFPDLVMIFKRDIENDTIYLARLGNHNQLFG